MSAVRSAAAVVALGLGTAACDAGPVAPSEPQTIRIEWAPTVRVGSCAVAAWPSSCFAELFFSPGRDGVLQIEEIQLRNIFEPFLELSLVSPSGTTYVWGCVLNATCTPGPTVARGRIYQLRLDGWPSSDTPVRLVFSYPG